MHPTHLQASTTCALAPRLVRRPPPLLLPQAARSTAPWGPGARTGVATAARVAPRTQSVSPRAWRVNGPKHRPSGLTWQKPTPKLTAVHAVVAVSITQARTTFASAQRPHPARPLLPLPHLLQAVAAAPSSATLARNVRRGNGKGGREKLWECMCAQHPETKKQSSTLRCVLCAGVCAGDEKAGVCCGGGPKNTSCKNAVCVSNYPSGRRML